MPALAPERRKDLERVIIKARNLVVADVKDRLKELNVDEGKRGALSETQAKLRVRLRAHGKQIGDVRNCQSEAQQIDRLVQECAYEQWHRMIFVRFLAENEFLIDPEYGQAVSMEALVEIAEESKVDPWVLGGQFASAALPAIFRKDDPLLEVRLSSETQRKLNDLLGSLPPEVFTADDSLGWVYQFWQSEEKDRVNASGEKIDGRSIPAVTQLFTEHYMVLFLLHNTLGAWHAGRVLAKNPSLATIARDEAELRRAVALETAGGYEFEYLRFVRDPNPSSDDGDDAQGPWRPMGGAYEGWPKTAAELKVLDPSCGSGHFLVAAFELLVRLRMHEEELSVEAAVEAVLRDNLFGLEIDPRCTQIAAFNVAMAVWKLTGPKPLPPMRNIACSGVPLGNSRDEWMKSLKAALLNSDLGFQWGQLYDMFSKADTLGSLINPQRFFGSGLMTDEQLEQISQALSTVIVNDRNATDEQQELAAAAQGLTRATELLSGRYTLVITNVPYLGRGKQGDELKKYLDTQYALGKADLATAFVLRCMEFCSQHGTTTLVTPQNCLFLTSFKQLRANLLKSRRWDFVTRLGAGAFETIGGHVVNVALLSLTMDTASQRHHMAGIDVSAVKEASNKAAQLARGSEFGILLIPQHDQLANPDMRIVLSASIGSDKRLSDYARVEAGYSPGDVARFEFKHWELALPKEMWQLMQTGPENGGCFTGLCSVCIDPRSELYRNLPGFRLRGERAWNRLGVAINKMSQLPATLYLGVPFNAISPVLTPNNIKILPAIWAFASSEEYRVEVRKLDQKLSAANRSLIDVPFNLKRWQKIASDKYPNGLPEPESDDPTQWLFHGRPEHSTAPLQVAVARLLGYRWPAEQDSEMRLSQRARDLVVRCSELDEFIDDDGIVCIPSVRGEDPASDRLLRLLHAVGVNHSENLETWLRDKFFQEHCELFHQRPFIWHIWDGKKDGFAALVNYHKLAGPQGKKLLESLTYSYLGDWITRQEAAVKNNESGADDRLLAAKELQEKLEAILHGEPPYDIFVRWKPLHEQPIGWTPDINDGVRMNIRPFMLAELSRGRKGAGGLRFPPKIKWTKDRGKEPKRPPEDYPWFWGWDEMKDDPTNFAGSDTFTGDRWNDLHYTNAFKLKAREAAKNKEAQS
ncbi:MAG: N-6 DNA methylase [Planctomycetales bacterium]|nr:N-6 DNA methylase [Planctomycetales bacterium]